MHTCWTHRQLCTLLLPTYMPADTPGGHLYSTERTHEGLTCCDVNIFLKSELEYYIYINECRGELPDK